MAYEAGTVLFAFSLTLMAGLSTGIGSALAFLPKPRTPGFNRRSGIFRRCHDLCVFGGNFCQGQRFTGSGFRPVSRLSGDHAGFFGGIALIAAIDILVPGFENPHEVREVEDIPDRDFNLNKKSLHRMGIFSALAIAIHNVPEGIATFVGALADPALGTSIAVAVAIHNIPEGIAVSVPIYYATGSRKKAFQLSFLSGLSEPAGALIGYFLILQYFTDTLSGLMFAAVAGIMVFISLDELLPTAEKYGEHHIAMYGVVAGMAVMAASLVLFA